MIVAFPLSLSPASSSAATRKRKKKTKTRKMCQTRRARARAAPLVSPHLPSSRLCCCCSKIFFFVLSSSSSSCTSASFCTPLSLCLPPIVFSHNLSLSSRTFSPSLRTRSSSLGLLCRRTLVRTSRRRLCTLSRGSVSTGLGRTSRAGTTRSLRNTRFGRSSSRRLKSALQRFPQRLCREKRQSLPSSRRHWLPRRGRGSRGYKSAPSRSCFACGVVVDHPPPSLNTHATTTRKKRCVE